MFNAEINQIADSIDHLTTKRGRRIVGLCLLGKGDGSGTLIVPNGLPREIWARRSDTRELFTLHLPPNPIIAYQDGNAAIETMEMRYGYEADSDRLQILDALSAGGQQAVGATSPIESLIAQGYWTPLNQIITLRARPSNPVSTSIAVDGPYWYPRTSTSRYLFSSGSWSLSGEITALTSGQHQIAAIYLDTTTGNLGALTNTAATAAGTLPSRSEWTYLDVQALTFAPTYIPIIVVYLYYGQTAVQEADIYRTWDLRPLFGNGGSGTITGPGTSIDRAIATWNGTGGTALRNNPSATVDLLGNVLANGFGSTVIWTATLSSDTLSSVPSSRIIISAESGTTDNLVTVTDVPTGRLLFLQAASGHTITVKNGTGNIFLNGGADFVLSGDKTLLLFCDGVNWADVGAGGGSTGSAGDALFLVW